MLRPVVAFGMQEKGSMGDGIFSFLFARYVFCSIDNELLDGHRGHKIYSTKKWSKIKLFKGHYSASGLMYYLTLHSVMKSHALSIQSLIWQCNLTMSQVTVCIKCVEFLFVPHVFACHHLSQSAGKKYCCKTFGIKTKLFFLFFCFLFYFLLFCLKFQYIDIFIQFHMYM